MANTLIVGLPGNGKGVMAMNLLVEELKLGKRPIITNLAVEKWPWIAGSHELRRGLRDYLLATFDDDFNCVERIFRVSDEAVQNFYLYRALSRRTVAKLGEFSGQAHVAQRSLSRTLIATDSEFVVQGLR